MRRASTAATTAIAMMLAPAAEHHRTERGVAACMARSAGAGGNLITWYEGPRDDEASQDRWCRAVGPPIVVTKPVTAEKSPAPLSDLVVLSWNAHLAEGRLGEIVEALRNGQFTAGRPARRFVLLLQEMYRRGPDVPEFAPDARTAFAIKARDARAADAGDYARLLGLAFFYVPSMRNGAGLREDRGNAIVSTERLDDLFALELPLERQRRVAIGASIDVRTSQGVERMRVVDVHLEPLSSPASLWVFRNPRRRQTAAILSLLASDGADTTGRSIGTVLGGDFNTIQGGVEEDAYAHARQWSQSLIVEDARATHNMGRLDYLFFRLADGWTAETRRIDDKFGSDHHPVLGSFLEPGMH